MTSLLSSPWFHQFMIAGLIGFLLGQISVAMIQAPRWLVSMLSE